MEYIVEDTKTESGTKQAPMTDEVYDCFKLIIENRKKPKVEPMIDGKIGFLYLDKNEMSMVAALHWEKYFQHIREKYNSIHKVQMPTITPHVCRHTFFQYGKKRYEFQNSSVYYGTFGNWCYLKYLYPCEI